MANDPSCKYTPLAISTSAISFLTFLYAVTVGLIYYYGLAKSSPEETDRFIATQIRTFNEFKEVVDQMAEEQPSAQPAEDEITLKLMVEMHDLATRTSQHTQSLYLFQQGLKELDDDDDDSSAARGCSLSPRLWFKWLRACLRPLMSSRIRYLIIREELQKRIAERDQLMSEMRYLHQRSVSILPLLLRLRPYLTYVVRGSRHLSLRSDRIAKAAREEQRDLLENISRRISSLEGSGGTTTPAGYIST